MTSAPMLTGSCTILPAVSGEKAAAAGAGKPLRRAAGRDPTAGRATRAATLAADIALIEKTARQAAGAQAPYLVEAVTEDMPWHYLRMRKGLPLGEKSFNGIRRQFYYLLAKEKRIV